MTSPRQVLKKAACMLYYVSDEGRKTANVAVFSQPTVSVTATCSWPGIQTAVFLVIFPDPCALLNVVCLNAKEKLFCFHPIVFV